MRDCTANCIPEVRHGPGKAKALLHINYHRQSSQYSYVAAVLVAALSVATTVVVIYLCLQVVYYYKTIIYSSIVQEVHCPHGDICGTGSTAVFPSSVTCIKAALSEKYGDTQTMQQILTHHMSDSNSFPCNACVELKRTSMITRQERWLQAPAVFILFFGRERVSLFNPCQGSGFSSFYMLQMAAVE